MNAFEYVNPSTLKEVPALLGQKQDRSAVIIAGGIDLLGELKDNLIAPGRVVNLKSLPDLKYIRHGKKAVEIGALTTLTDVALDEKVRASYTAVAQAAESVASLQIRNVGTVGGNLCQRPRCWYYRGEEFYCLKKGGDLCYAVDGNSKYHAILGGSPCYIVHPSDLAPALIALGASVTVHGAGGARTLPLEEFFVLPEEDIARETVLKPDEVVTQVTVPVPAPGTKSVYLKFKEKGSMDFASSAVAVAAHTEGGICRSARIVLGGVAPKPWRAKAAEGVLSGQRVTEALLAEAARAALAGAQPLKDNAYKVPLTRALIRRAVASAVA